MPWDVRRILGAVALTVALCIAALVLDENVDLGVSLPLRVLLTLLFPAALLALGYFPRSDLRRARTLLRRIF